MKEEWKLIEGYNGRYSISNFGKVRRNEYEVTTSNNRVLHYNEKNMSIHKNKYGYLTVRLSNGGISKTRLVHVLVAKAFIPNPGNLPCVNHIDENKSNPIYSNLEWCTYSYNNTYGTVLQRRRKKNAPILNEAIIESATRLSNQIISNLRAYKIKRHYVGVVRVDENGNEIERFNSESEAARKFGFERHLFIKTKDINGIKYIKGYYFYIERKIRKYNKTKQHVHHNTKSKLVNMKRVKQYDLNGCFMNEYPSCKEAGIAIGNVSYSCDIISCCKGRLKSSHNYIWRYSDDAAPAKYQCCRSRNVNQYSKSGEFIRSYTSINDAIRNLGYGTPSCIGNNLNGRAHSAYGYVWKYN